MKQMSQATEDRLYQAFYDSLEEIADAQTTDILTAFDSEYGYDEGGNRVTWPPLSPSYVYERGSAHPILVVDGDLRSAVGVVVDGTIIDSDVTSQKMKNRNDGSTISVAEISEILGGDRPHTNPSTEWMADSQNVSDVIAEHLNTAVDELMKSGEWYK